MKRIALIGLACLGVAATTATATAEPQAAAGESAIAYKLTIEGEQVTSWKSSGGVIWCPSTGGLVPVDGSGTETLTLRLAKPAGVSLRVAQPFAEWGGQLTVKAERAGTLTKRWSTLTERPATCGKFVAPLADETARTAGCGVFGYRLPVSFATIAGRQFLVSDDPSVDRWSGVQECPWMARDISEGGASTGSPGAGELPEVRGGLFAAALAPALRAPARLDGKSLVATATATSTQSATTEGVTVSATTTLRLTVRLESVLKIEVTIKPGKSIAGVSLGMSGPKALKATGAKPGPASWEGAGFGGVAGPNQTYWQAAGNGVTVQMVAPGRHRGKPPASAVVVWVKTSDRSKVTSKGIGFGSLPAAVKRAYPKGTFVRYGGGFGWWLVDGPGRRRTGFEFSRTGQGNPVRVIILGCKPPAGVPLQLTGVVDLSRDRIARC